MTHPTRTDSPKGTVLLLGNYRPTQVIARRLKARGHRIVCGLEGYEGDAEKSRAVDETWDHPSLSRAPEEFARALAGFLAARGDVTAVLPVAEPAVRFFAEHEIALPAHVRLVAPDPDLVRRCLDKRFMMELARNNDVPIAPFAEVHDFDALTRHAHAIGFPLVIRPASADTLLFGNKAITVTDAEDFATYFSLWPAGHDLLLLQKKAEGPRHNVYFAARNGRIERVLHALITRTDRADGSGLALDGVTLPLDPALKRDCERLVAALDYTGIGCAQFLVDPDTGTRSFLEINARIAGNHAVPEYCGLDLTGFVFDLASAPSSPAPAPLVEGRAGVAYSWLARDLQGHKGAYNLGGLPLGAYLRRVASAFATALRADVDVGFTWRDPVPGVLQICDELPLIGKLTRRRKTAARPAPAPASGAHLTRKA